MKTTTRFEAAIKKLYNAFQNNNLNPDDCKQCAVGNILDNNDFWKYFTDQHGSTKLNYVGLVNQKFGRTFNGYSPLELLAIEAVFLKACGYNGLGKKQLFKPENLKHNDVLFNGLEAVVGYLCELDDIKNIIDCSKLFDFEHKKHLEIIAI